MIHRILKQYMSDFALCNVRRCNHPTLSEYTYFSPVHRSNSRQDYFLTSCSTLPDISDTQIHPITISNHIPVFICMTKQKAIPPTKSWRLKTSLLIDPDVMDYFNKEWAISLETKESHHPTTSHPLRGSKSGYPWQNNFVPMSQEKKGTNTRIRNRTRD